MDTRYGTKWFTFYTKVRPWLACVFSLPAIMDYTQYQEVYTHYWWMMFSLLVSLAQPILCVVVFVKSFGDYEAFVRFVKGVLLFETLGVAYQQGVQQYVSAGMLIGPAILTFVFVLLVGLVLWFYLNVKYFEKRLFTVGKVEAEGKLVDAPSACEKGEEKEISIYEEVISDEECPLRCGELEMVANADFNDQESNMKMKKKTTLNTSLIVVTDAVSAILNILAILFLVISMNVQDAKRNRFEPWNPTAVYSAVLAVVIVVLGVAVYSFAKERFGLLACLSPVPIIVALVAFVEGSITDIGYFSDYVYHQYVNADVLAVFNALWLACIIAAGVVAVLPAVIHITQKIVFARYQSVSYREKCYRRVAKIHSYFEKGIITEEEYNQAKRDILKKVLQEK